MNTIISKIDYELNDAIDFGYFEMVNFWLKICDKKYILEQAISVLEDDEHNKMFFSPTICYMILKNSMDVEKDIVKKLSKTIITNNDLGKISMRNETFLSLCLSNPFLELDENDADLIVAAIEDRYYPNKTGNTNVTYNKLPKKSNKVIEYSDDRMKLDVSVDDIEAFRNRSYINVTQSENDLEIESLTKILSCVPMDSKISKAISKQYEKYLYELELISKNGEEIIRLIREKNRLVK